ncbi:uncharacterized protein TNCV_1267071 [Trichonephila clavipes]|nr:uncharacterized protein TNCV_1267071 [Trichonephila clavipes]
MPLRIRRSHYQQLTEFELGRVIGIREDEFSFGDILERLGRNVSPVPDCWEQWTRDGIASRRPSYGWPRGNNEREDHRIRRTVVGHRTASEIRAEVGTTATQQLEIGFIKDSTKPGAL